MVLLARDIDAMDRAVRRVIRRGIYYSIQPNSPKKRAKRGTSDDTRDHVSVKKNLEVRKLSCTPRVWGRWRKYR